MIFSAIARRRTWIALALSVAFVLVAFRADSATSLLGAGSSFVESLYDGYIPQLQQDTGIRVRYLTIDSGPGFRKLGDKVTNFASSDFYPEGNEGQRLLRLDQVPGLALQRIPVATGGIAIIYNIGASGDQGSSTTDLRISRDMLARIFTGEVTNWQQVNASLPNLDLRVVVRCDVSGSNYILSQYLSNVPNSGVEKFPGPKWWQNVGLKPFAARELDSGVTAAVALTEGSIGYVQLGYALDKNLPTARIENASGQFVAPTLSTIEAATANLEYDEDFNATGLENPAVGYPIVGMNSVFVYKRQDKAETTEALQKAVEWMLTKGQSLNADLGYGSIPDDVAERAIEAINRNLTVSPWTAPALTTPVESPTREACR
jgi:phosphate transport system substrate-binding protein